MAVHIGKAEPPPLEPVRQPLVVDAHQVEQRGLKIMHVNLVLYRIEREVIARAIGETRLHSTACIQTVYA